MTIEAEILDMSQLGLITFRLRYPRYLHSEILRHRMFAHSVVSSRAVGFENMVKAIGVDIAKPVKWLSDKKGMSAGEELSKDVTDKIERLWAEAFETSSSYARELHELGLHHSVTNRLLEPWMNINQVLTSCHWSNFYKLRISEFADVTICALATEMKRVAEEYIINNPKMKWKTVHMPFVEEEEMKQHDLLTLMKISAARCARMSYLPIGESERDIDKDVKLADKLITQDHWCYDDKTEIFTNRGWILFENLEQTDKVAAVVDNGEKFVFNFEIPSHIHKSYYSGDMCTVQSSRIDFSVTPNHSMLFGQRKKTGGYGKPEILRADELMKRNGRIYCQASASETKENNLGDFERGCIYGFFLGDGFTRSNKVQWRLKIERKLSYMRSLLHKLGISYVENKCDNDVIQFSCNRNHNAFNYVEDLKCRDKRIDYKIYEESLDFIKGVFDGLINSDGSVDSRGHVVYDTTSNTLASDVMYLSVFLGKNPTLVNRLREKKEHAPCFRIQIKNNNIVHQINDTRNEDSKMKYIKYIGIVYCATVSTGILLVRRNGKQMICGNSPFEHQAVYLPYDKLTELKSQFPEKNWSGNYQCAHWLQSRWLFEHATEEIRKQYSKISP